MQTGTIERAGARVLVVPQLRRHPYLGAREPGFLQAIRDAPAHLLLVAVGGCAVDVAIAGLDGVGHCLRGVGLVEVPCAVPKQRDR